MQIEYEITKREKDIMKVLWSEKESLTASEIAKRTDEISISTVQSALKNLVRKGLAEVADIVYSGTVLSRSYRATITSAQYEMQKLLHNFGQRVNKDFSTSGFVAALLQQEKDNEKALREIEELEKMLSERKMQLWLEEEKRNKG